MIGSYLGQRDYGFDDTQTVPAPGAGLTPPAADGPASAQITAVGKLHLPYLPVPAAVLSMAVYGLTVPGSPLQFEVSGTGFAILSGCLAVGGGVMMSIFAPFLGKATPPFPSRNSRGARHSHRVTKKTKRSPAVHPRQLHPRSRRTPPGPTPMTSARPRQTRRLPPGLTPKRMLSGIDEFVAGSGYICCGCRTLLTAVSGQDHHRTRRQPAGYAARFSANDPRARLARKK